MGRENIFKQTMGNESLHQDSNDNGFRIVNFATSKNLVVKSTIFPQRHSQAHLDLSWWEDAQSDRSHIDR